MAKILLVKHGRFEVVQSVVMTGEFCLRVSAVSYSLCKLLESLPWDCECSHDGSLASMMSAAQQLTFAIDLSSELSQRVDYLVECSTAQVCRR